jgi:outer membrane protein TolC
MSRSATTGPVARHARRGQDQNRLAVRVESLVLQFELMDLGLEDAVAALSVLEQESAAQEDVVKLARRSVAVSVEQYKAGTVTYLNVVTAQATALANERSVVSLRGRRLVEAVALIRALGGGWSSTELH